jgi:hypothetical protein
MHTPPWLLGLLLALLLGGPTLAATPKNRDAVLPMIYNLNTSSALKFVEGTSAPVCFDNSTFNSSTGDGPCALSWSTNGTEFFDKLYRGVCKFRFRPPLQTNETLLVSQLVRSFRVDTNCSSNFVQGFRFRVQVTSFNQSSCGTYNRDHFPIRGNASTLDQDWPLTATVNFVIAGFIEAPCPTTVAALQSDSGGGGGSRLAGVGEAAASRGG